MTKRDRIRALKAELNETYDVAALEIYRVTRERDTALANSTRDAANFAKSEKGRVQWLNSADYAYGELEARTKERDEALAELRAYGRDKFLADLCGHLTSAGEVFKPQSYLCVRPEDRVLAGLNTLVKSHAGLVVAWESARRERDEAHAELARAAKEGEHGRYPWVEWYNRTVAQLHTVEEERDEVLADKRRLLTEQWDHAVKLEGERDEARAEVERLREQCGQWEHRSILHAWVISEITAHLKSLGQGFDPGNYIGERDSVVAAVKALTITYQILRHQWDAHTSQAAEVERLTGELAQSQDAAKMARASSDLHYGKRLEIQGWLNAAEQERDRLRTDLAVMTTHRDEHRDGYWKLHSKLLIVEKQRDELRRDFDRVLREGKVTPTDEMSPFMRAVMFGDGSSETAPPVPLTAPETARSGEEGERPQQPT